MVLSPCLPLSPLVSPGLPSYPSCFLLLDGVSCLPLSLFPRMCACVGRCVRFPHRLPEVVSPIVSPSLPACVPLLAGCMLACWLAGSLLKQIPGESEKLKKKGLRSRKPATTSFNLPSRPEAEFDTSCITALTALVIQYSCCGIDGVDHCVEAGTTGACLDPACLIGTKSV